MTLSLLVPIDFESIDMNKVKNGESVHFQDSEASIKNFQIPFEKVARDFSHNLGKQNPKLFFSFEKKIIARLAFSTFCQAQIFKNFCDIRTNGENQQNFCDKRIAAILHPVYIFLNFIKFNSKFNSMTEFRLREGPTEHFCDKEEHSKFAEVF